MAETELTLIRMTHSFKYAQVHMVKNRSRTF